MAVVSARGLRRFARAALVCCLLWPLTHEASAWLAQTFVSKTVIVRVEVVVLDKDRQPVKGLTAGEFQVSDEGKPTPVSVFSTVDLPDGWGFPKSWMKDNPFAVAANDSDYPRLIVLVLDDAVIPADPHTAQSVRDIARMVLGQLRPSDLGAVFFSLNKSAVQNFTRDTAILESAVNRFGPGFVTFVAEPGAGGLDTDAHYYVASLATLRRAVKYLTDAPQGQKLIVHVSPGIPIDFTQLAPARAGQPMGQRDVQAALRTEQRLLFDEARRANISVYSIDPGGLKGIETYIATRLIARGVSAVNAFRVAHGKAVLNLDSLRDVADGTGGFAVVDTDDFRTGINALFYENQSFYVLGFVPSSTDTSQRERRLEVRLPDHPGFTVKARTRYRLDPQATNSFTGTRRLKEVIERPVPTRELPMRVWLGSFPRADQGDSSVLVAVSVQRPAVSARQTDTIELLTVALTADGVTRDSDRLTATLTLRPTSEPAVLEMLSQVNLKPGRYEFRLAAHDAALNTGSVYTDFDVPDLARLPLVLSSVAFAFIPPPAVVSTRRVENPLPVVPTTRREFSSQQRVEAFLRVYQSTRLLDDVTLTMTIRDEHDAPVFNKTELLGKAVFRHGASHSAASVQFSLPLTELPPGRYLATFDADRGSTRVQQIGAFVKR